MTGLYSKYLNESPFEWLLEDSDPSISYLTRRDIIQDGSCDERYDSILESREISRMISKNGPILGNTRNFDLFYKGAMWCFAEAVERGLDNRSPCIQASAEFIINAGQTPSGGFSLNWKPRTEVACRTGDMIRYLIRAGYADERVSAGIAWIASHQRHDLEAGGAQRAQVREDSESCTDNYRLWLRCGHALCPFSCIIRGAPIHAHCPDETPMPL